MALAGEHESALPLSPPDSPILAGDPSVAHHKKEYAGRNPEMRNRRLQRTLETPQGRAEFEFLRQEMPRSTLQSALQIYNPAQPAMASEATLQKLLKIYNFSAAQLFSLDGICNLMANKVRWSI